MNIVTWELRRKQQKIPLGIGDIMMVLEDLNTVAGLYFTGQVKNRVVFDTEALVSITNDVAVFIYWDWTQAVPTLMEINSTAALIGSRTIRLRIVDDKGCVQNIYVRAYYLPDASIGLLNPQ